MPHTPTLQFSEPIVHQLHNEWRRITIRAEQLDQVHRWGLPGSPVRSLDELLGRCGYSPTGTAHADDADDEFLLRLVALARSDQLALRIVLQRILPPLCAIARRHTSTPSQRHELMDDLIANAWSIIRKYPVERRPRRVASNLVRDINFETLVRPTRRFSSTEVPTEHVHLDQPNATVAVEPLNELVDLLNEAQATGAMPKGDIDFICQLITHGRAESLAITLDVTPRTIRNRRNAVVHRLRTLAEAAA